MKTVAQWAEQLPELIRIELIEEAERENSIKEKRDFLEDLIEMSIVWVDTTQGQDFWEGINDNVFEDQTSSDYLDESVPYTKSEVDAMILEFADPNDDVCKVMLANVLANQITGKVNQLSNDLDETKTMDGFYSKMNLAKENEALKSTIEGLNAIVAEKKHYIECLESDLERKTKDLYGTIERNDWLHKERYPLYRDLCDTKGQLKLAKERIKELEQPVGRPETNERPTLLDSFLNLFK